MAHTYSQYVTCCKALAINNVYVHKDGKVQAIGLRPPRWTKVNKNSSVNGKEDEGKEENASFAPEPVEVATTVLSIDVRNNSGGAGSLIVGAPGSSMRASKKRTKRASIKAGERNARLEEAYLSKPSLVSTT